MSDDVPGDAPAANNPYKTPADAPTPAPPKPRVLPWVVAGGCAGAAGFGFAELHGRIAPMAAALPLGVGGAAVGLIAGGLFGRVVGRLLVARYSFRMLDHRHSELREELEERRKTADRPVE